MQQLNFDITISLPTVTSDTVFRSISTWESSMTPASVSTVWTSMFSLDALALMSQYRRRKVGHVGYPHRLTKEDAMKWFQTKYDGVILSSKAK